MGAGGAQKPAKRRKELPRLIVSDADLAAHISALADAHPHFSEMLRIAGTVPLRRIDPGFRGLFWIVTGQQISAAAGRSIFARAESILDSMTPQCVLDADDALLKSAGLSAPKIRTLRAVASAIDSGTLDIEALAELEAETAIEQLCCVKGIGPWTAQVYLLFALGHTDVFPAGDLALKEGVRHALDIAERPSEKELAARAEDWRPLRSAAARLTWAYYGAAKRGGADSTPA
jgi:DNA-3-methyladenine glycosylase II